MEGERPKGYTDTGTGGGGGCWLLSLTWVDAMDASTAAAQTPASYRNPAARELLGAIAQKLKHKTCEPQATR